MSKKTALKEKLAVLFVKGLAKLPLTYSRFLGRFVGRLTWWLAKKQVHFSKTNIQHCLPDLEPEKQQQLLKNSFISAGELVAELSATWLWPYPKLLKLPLEIENYKLLEEAYKKRNGVLLLSPHMGNWEMLMPLLIQDFDVVAMYKPPRMKAMDKLIKNVREKGGGELFPANTSGVRAIFKAVKNGKLSILLPDQEPAENAGIFVPFFKQPAWTMTLPAKILLRTHCEIFFSIVIRTNKGFKLIIREVENVIITQSIEQITANINQGMEQLILEYPEQYQWSYKRFYLQPEGQPQIYI